MLFKQFLQDRLATIPWGQSVYVFLAPTYNPVIASYCVQALKKSHDLTNFSLDDHEFSEFERAAYTKFLGQVSVIWLGNCSEYGAATQKKLISFLKTYSGPHTIVAFWNEKEYGHDGVGAVVYEKDFDFETIQLFFQYALGKKITTTSSTIQGYTPEQTIIFYLYTFFINDPNILIKNGWADKLFIRESSLFELSKLFFAKKKDPFFIMWNRVRDLYAPVFWTVFWSEQLWNAFLVVYLRQKKEFNTAKQVQGRLPFSFLQYDWQNYTSQELQQAHALVCNLDRNLKLSANPDSIDLLFYTFFRKK